jgi:hypothetical protein
MAIINRAVIEHHLEDRLARLELFETLDSVFEAFLKSNEFRKRRYTLAEMIETFKGTTTAKHFLYEHWDVPYRGTICTLSDHVADWFCIKLANNGFQYTFKSGRHLSRHNFETWIRLEDQHIHAFRSVVGSIAKYCDQFTLFYTYEEKRVDMKFFPKDEDGPHIMITFEQGYAEETYTSSPRYVPT